MAGAVSIHSQQDGAPDGPVLMLAHPLGADLRIFDGLVPHLPQDMRIVRMDMRGHGASDCPPSPYSMGMLVRDTEQLIEAQGLQNIVFAGVSIGGLIAQGLAAKRPDLLRGLVLSNTAARIGTRDQWQTRIDALTTDPFEAFVDATMTRWFGPPERRDTDVSAVRDVLLAQNPQGVAGCCHAIAGSDFYTTTATLNMPTLGIAGNRDGSTPPDLVRETIDLIQGAQFHLIRGAGHVPFVEKPAEYAALLTRFITGLDTA